MLNQILIIKSTTITTINEDSTKEINMNYLSNTHYTVFYDKLNTKINITDSKSLIIIYNKYEKIKRVLKVHTKDSKLSFKYLIDEEEYKNTYE